MDNAKDDARKTDDEWRERLTPDRSRVLREHGTEPAWSHPLNREHGDGVFLCAGCGAALFSSDAKFDSGSGWPSYFAAMDGHAVGHHASTAAAGMVRTEMHCRRCGGHLGHIVRRRPRADLASATARTARRCGSSRRRPHRRFPGAVPSRRRTQCPQWRAGQGGDAADVPRVPI